MLGRDGLPQDVRVDLGHVRPVAADGADVPPLPPPFGAGQELGREERGQGRGAQENRVGAPDMLL